MTRSLRIALVLVAASVLAQHAAAQESKAAKATREKLDKDRFRRDLGNVEEAYQEMLRRVST